MGRSELARPLALLTGAVTFAALGGLAWAHRGPAGFGWFAYAPLNSSVSSYTSADGRYSTSFFAAGQGGDLSLAWPGLLALLLGAALTVASALTSRRTLRATLAAAAAAAAMSQAPALSAPVGVGLERLVVVLVPAALALLVRRVLTRPATEDGGGAQPSTAAA